jgi:hypothetical protein
MDGQSYGSPRGLHMRMPRRGFAGLGAALAAARPALADPAWPARPVRYIVPLSPGGTLDSLTRAFAQRLQPLANNQPMVVENRTGGGGTIGGTVVAGARPDGYTLFMGDIGPNIVAGEVLRSAPYDPATAFTPILHLVNVPLVLVARKTLPATNLKQVLELGPRAIAGRADLRLGRRRLHGASDDGVAGPEGRRALRAHPLSRRRRDAVRHPARRRRPDAAGGRIRAGIHAHGRCALHRHQHGAALPLHAAGPAHRLGRAGLRRRHLARPLRPRRHGAGADCAHQCQLGNAAIATPEFREGWADAQAADVVGGSAEEFSRSSCAPSSASGSRSCARPGSARNERVPCSRRCATSASVPTGWRR